MTYYETLEISENASDEVIKVAYKTLAKKYHPDLCKENSDTANKKMQLINEAFDVLSDPKKRRQYDDYLHNRRNSYKKNEKNSSGENKSFSQKQRSAEHPSLKKSCLIIFLFLFLCFASILHGYIDPIMYDYAFVLGITDFLIINTVLMIVPMLVFIIKRNLLHRDIKKLCAINSIAFFIISILLYIFEISQSVVVGGLGAVAYYFINYHILLQIDFNVFNFKKFSSCIALIFLTICIIITGNIIFINEHYQGHYPANGSISNNNENSYYTDIAGQIYNLEGYENCIIVRIATYQDKFTAELDYLILKDISDERQLIAEMNHWSSDGNGGKGLMIERGELVEEIDSWCFHPSRKVGDIALIENPYGYSICYISAIFTD